MSIQIQIENARNLFSDEQSLTIFNHCVNFAKAGDYAHLLDMVSDSIAAQNGNAKFFRLTNCSDYRIFYDDTFEYKR